MRGRASALAALLVATAGAAGCGGSNGSGNDAVPTAAGGDGQTDTTSATTTGDSTSREDAMVRFTRCLRDHGIQVSESSSGGKTSVRIGGGGPGKGSRGMMNAAMRACQKYAPSGGGNLDPQQRQQFLDQARSFARCMRDHGQDVPDPQVGGDGGIQMRIGGPGRMSPAFKAAQQACQSKLPNAGAPKAAS
jgi:hypothetical protein